MVKHRPLSAHRSRPTGNVNANLLLSALPADEYERILPSLDVIPLKLKAVLHRAGEPIDHVYFPGGGFCSILTVLKDGGMVEVATIGREGLVGISAALDNSPATATSMVQGATDTCYRMEAGAFRRELERRNTLYDVLTDYTQALISFIMQSTACNAVHSLEQRLARWLLTARDRMESDEFPLTQEFAAIMLGVSRPAVTIVASTLQKAGLITYHRGQIKILDGRKLEAASCECYRTTTEALEAVRNRGGRP